MIIDTDLMGCSFCDFDREIIEHIFLHCYEMKPGRYEAIL
jgi:hypothetical protein